MPQHISVLDEEERLGQRPELLRTYIEIEKRFLEEGSKNKEMNGISSEGYLEKARAMFQDMDLQWDLDELDKIAVASYAARAEFLFPGFQYLVCPILKVKPTDTAIN